MKKKKKEKKKKKKKKEKRRGVNRVVPLGYLLMNYFKKVLILFL